MTGTYCKFGVPALWQTGAMAQLKSGVWVNARSPSKSRVKDLSEVRSKVEEARKLNRILHWHTPDRRFVRLRFMIRLAICLLDFNKSYKRAAVFYIQ